MDSGDSPPTPLPRYYPPRQTYLPRFGDEPVMQRPTHRRDFLQQSILGAGALAAAGTLRGPTAAQAQNQQAQQQQAPAVPATAPQATGSPVAANQRITLGVIGIGPRCQYDLKAMLPMPDVQCVAIADVQASRRSAGKQLVDDHYQNSDCQLYRDFRDLLARPDIDAVLIATGDRWHAAASILAAQAGKHVYSEKPCGLTIGDCIELASTMDQTGRVFQAGTQRRSVPNFQIAAQLARSGQLGQLHTLYASVYTPAVETSWLPGEPTPDAEVCDWNLWLGPAPWRPYNSQYVAGRWRGYWDFDSGAKLLDWGAHTVDLCQWAANADDTLPIHYEPQDNQIIAHYASGLRLVLDFLETPFGQRPGWVQSLGTCPVRFEGSEGSVETGDSGGMVIKPAALSASVASDYQRVVGLDVSAHARDFFDCIHQGGTPRAHQQVMLHSHVACHAAALAWLLKRKLTLDPETLTFVDDDEANRLRSRPQRDDWKA